MQPLKRWLIENKHTALWLSRQLKIALSTVSRYTCGYSFPVAHIMLEIQKITKNEINLNEWVAFMQKEIDEKKLKETEEKKLKETEEKTT